MEGSSRQTTQGHCPHEHSLLWMYQLVIVDLCPQDRLKLYSLWTFVSMEAGRTDTSQRPLQRGRGQALASAEHGAFVENACTLTKSKHTLLRAAIL
jgi:hypothetical protein